jgi:hypothetical protein
MTTEAMRAQFEAWVTKQPWFVACLGLMVSGDDYIDPCVNSRWQGYQTALSSPAVVALVDKSGNASAQFCTAIRSSADMKVIRELDAALAPFTTGAGQFAKGEEE